MYTSGDLKYINPIQRLRNAYRIYVEKTSTVAKMGVVRSKGSNFDPSKGSRD